MEFNQTNQNQGDVNNHASTPSPSPAEWSELHNEPADSNDMVGTLSADQPANTLPQIIRRFTHHPPKGDQAERYKQVRTAALALAILFMDRCPPSRELSLALTNLEQAVFWANASIARNE